MPWRVSEWLTYDLGVTKWENFTEIPGMLEFDQGKFLHLCWKSRKVNCKAFHEETYFTYINLFRECSSAILYPRLDVGLDTHILHGCISIKFFMIVQILLALIGHEPVLSQDVKCNMTKSPEFSYSTFYFTSPYAREITTIYVCDSARGCRAVTGLAVHSFFIWAIL